MPVQPFWREKFDGRTPGRPPRSRRATRNPRLVQFSIEEDLRRSDRSLENPGAPQSFQMTEAPQIEIGLRTRGESRSTSDIYECVLTIAAHREVGRQDRVPGRGGAGGIFGIRGVTPPTSSNRSSPCIA